MLRGTGAFMLGKVSRKLALAALVAVGVTDLQLYAYRFHAPTEMLGQYLRRHIVPDGPADSTGGASIVPDRPSRMEAPVQKS